MTTIARFDIDELASLILLRAVLGGDSARHQLVDVESVPAGVALEALGDPTPQQLCDGHPVLGGTDTHAPGDVLRQNGLKPDFVDAHLRHTTIVPSNHPHMEGPTK